MAFVLALTIFLATAVHLRIMHLDNVQDSIYLVVSTLP